MNRPPITRTMERPAQNARFVGGLQPWGRLATAAVVKRCRRRDDDSGMNDVLSIAASGLGAAQAQLAATADNLANADTPGYKARRADLVELSGGGVAVGGVSVDPSAGPALPDGREGSNVDLAAESVDLLRE